MANAKKLKPEGAEAGGRLGETLASNEIVSTIVQAQKLPGEEFDIDEILKTTKFARLSADEKAWVQHRLDKELKLALPEELRADERIIEQGRRKAGAAERTAPKPSAAEAPKTLEDKILGFATIIEERFEKAKGRGESFSLEEQVKGCQGKLGDEGAKTLRAYLIKRNVRNLKDSVEEPVVEAVGKAVGGRLPEEGKAAAALREAGAMEAPAEAPKAPGEPRVPEAGPAAPPEAKISRDMVEAARLESEMAKLAPAIEKAAKTVDEYKGILGAMKGFVETERKAAVVSEYERLMEKKQALETARDNLGFKTFEEFNLKTADLEKIEGFSELSAGQRLLVAENLRQLTLGRIQEEAAAKYRAETVQAKFLGRVWRGITKQYQIAKLEKATAEEIKKGGSDAHGKVLEQLAKGTRELGLEVRRNEKGEAEIQYASGLEDLTKEEQGKMNNFNEIASHFSRMPYEWSLDTASKKQREDFEKVKGEFEQAKKDILELKAKRSSGKEAALYLSDIDNKLRLNQFLNTHPEVEKELQAVEDQPLWTRALKNVITERGLYMGAGYAVRTATASLIGAAAVPLAAAGLGGWMAHGRARETLRERERMARKGIKERVPEAKNVVDADKLKKKLARLVERIDAADAAEDDKEKEKLLASLRVRLRYTQDKIEDGLVNFGKLDERLFNQYQLIDKLNSSQVFSAREIMDATSLKDLEDRLDKFLALRERKISEAQKKYLLKQFFKGAAYGAGFAAAGWALRHFAFGEDASAALKAEQEPNGVKVPPTPEEAEEAAKAALPEESRLVGEELKQQAEANKVIEEAIVRAKEGWAGRVTVGEKEGLSNPIMDQIKFNPKAFAEWAHKYKLADPDFENAAQVEKWAQNLAGRIVKERGLGKTWVSVADKLQVIVDPEAKTMTLQTVDGSTDQTEIRKLLMAAPEKLPKALPVSLGEAPPGAVPEQVKISASELMSKVDYEDALRATRVGEALTPHELYVAERYTNWLTRADYYRTLAGETKDINLKALYLNEAYGDERAAELLWRDFKGLLTHPSGFKLPEELQTVKSRLIKEAATAKAEEAVAAQPVKPPRVPFRPEEAARAPSEFMGRVASIAEKAKPADREWLETLPHQIGGRKVFTDISPGKDIVAIARRGRVQIFDLPKGFKMQDLPDGKFGLTLDRLPGKSVDGILGLDNQDKIYIRVTDGHKIWLEDLTKQIPEFLKAAKVKAH